MPLFLCFAAVAFLCVFPLCLFLFHLGPGLSLLAALGAFVLAHALYVSFFGLVSLFTPLDKPIEKQDRLCRFAVSFTSPLINFYAGIRAVVTGIELIPTDTRFLFVCNHRSMFDPLLTMESLRDYDISFITKPSNLKIPVAGRVAYAVGYLPIDRENDRNALKTILTAADYMKRDVCSIAVYPEGTRSKTKELLPFHAGCLKAAQRAKVPIVVAAMSGTERFQKMTVFAGAKVNLDILEVIPAETVCQMRTDALSNHIREKIQADLDRREREER